MPLHPESQRFLDLLAANPRPEWHEMPVEESRKLFNSMVSVFGQGPELHAVEDRQMRGVPVRIYRPVRRDNSPVIVYFHGGGWVLGNVGTHDSVCRRLAATSGHVVISVDYRLAPEHKYPAALDDAYRVVEMVTEACSELGINGKRLYVGGDSAGGNLAAAVCAKARDVSGPEIAKQVLIYPVIESDFGTDSYTTFAAGYGLTREGMQWYWAQYVDRTDADTRYACLAGTRPTDLPPALVITAEYDVLRDEGEHYAARLRAGGVDVKLSRYDGMLHGFVHFAGMFEQAGKAIDEVAAYLND